MLGQSIYEDLFSDLTQYKTTNVFCGEKDDDGDDENVKIIHGKNPGVKFYSQCFT